MIPFPPHASEHPPRLSHCRVEDGVYVDRLPAGTRLIVQTVHRQYFLETRGGYEALLSGHPQYCPDPVAVAVHGSSYETRVLLPGFIGPGVRLRFVHPSGRVIRTSRVRAVREVSSAAVICRETARKQCCGPVCSGVERGGPA